MQTKSQDQLAEMRPQELQAGLSLSDYLSQEGGSRLRQVWQEEGNRSRREREEQGEGGQRGEGGTRESMRGRGEQPALVVMGLVG